MKITIIALFICIYTLFAVEANSQNAKVSIQANDFSIQKVISEIEKQTDYLFVYDKNEVDVNKKVSVDVNNEPVSEVLNRVFEGSGVVYKVVGKNITLAKGAVVTESTVNQQVSKKVTGVVKDQNGEPIIGANVVEKGTTNGTVTAIDGIYSIEVGENAVLQYSYIGYNLIEQSVGKQTVINVLLQENTQALEEVIVVGYGTQKKVNLTGAVAAVDKEVLESRPVSNVASALQGAVPGLKISTGGAPGSSSTIRVRGQGSLSNDGKTPPYILIDGVPADESTMLGLNPDDVENISVLKDAASAAIYGAKAAFGVILITTKSGANDKDKLEVNYSTNLDFAAFTVIPDMANTIQFARAWDACLINQGSAPYYTDDWYRKAEEKMKNPSAPSTEASTGNPNDWKRFFDSFDNVDWYNEYYKSGFSSFQQKHTLSLSGSSGKINYYVSAGYRDNGSNMRYGDWKNTQYSGLARINAKMTSWLDFGLNIRYSNGDVKEPTGNNDGDGTGIIYHNIFRSWPMQYLKDPNGNYNYNTNIPWLISGGTTSYKKQQLIITPTLVIKPLEGWRINFDFSSNMQFNSTKKVKQNVPYYMVNGSVDEATWNANESNTYVKREFDDKSYFTTNLYTSYDRKIGNHEFTGMIGMQQEIEKYVYSWSQRTNILFPSVPVQDLSGGERTLGDSEKEWSTVGVFARINYNYDNKYLLEVNGRYDASSKFKQGNRWGFFPSVSLGYNISREKFWENIEETVNHLKIRFSYGTLGNQNVPDYTYLPQLKHGYTDFIMGDMRPLYVQNPAIISPNLTWEKSKTINGGIDASFLSNRLLFSLDVYNRITENMFGPSVQLPGVLGGNVPDANNASLSTVGTELTLEWRDHVENFSYGIKFNLSDYQTKIKKYYNPTGILTSWAEGRKLGEIWGYETDRYFKEDDFIVENGVTKLKEDIPNQDYIYAEWHPGDIKYKDLNGDGKINEGENTLSNPGDKKIIGNNTPRFQYGVMLDGAYKGFDVKLFFEGVGKCDIWTDDVTFWGFQSWGQTGLMVQHLDYWREDNLDAYYPRPYMEGYLNDKNHKKQTKYLLNGAYLRLKNVQIGYSLPNKLLQKAGLNRARIYLSGENLFTVTDFPDFYDPEAYGKVHPIQKHISVGLNVSF